MADEKTSESFSQIAVIDSGSGFIKAGFTSEIAPTIVLPTVIGVSKDLIGFEAQSQLDSKDLLRPMQHGVVTNWDEMEKIWNFTLKNELRLETTSNVPCMVTQSSSATKDNREKMLHIFFEGLDVPAFYVSNQQVLSLYANSLTAGLVIDCGFDTCHIVPVTGGKPVPGLTKRWDVGGIDLTNELRSNLIQSGTITKINGCKENTIRNIKERCCFVSQDVGNDIKEGKFVLPNHKKTNEFELPDGSTIVLKDETITIPEILFTPSKYLSNETKQNGKGLAQLVCDTLLGCDDKIQAELCSKIEVVGGGSMFRGFAQRLEKDLKILLKDKNNLSSKIKIRQSKERKYAAWIGGSIFAGLDTFKDMWISSDEWDEIGPSVVHRCQTLEIQLDS